MILSKKDYIKFHDSKEEYYKIKYRTDYSSGEVIVKKSLYETYLKRFNRAMKDCEIIYMGMSYESIWEMV